MSAIKDSNPRSEDELPTVHATEHFLWEEFYCPSTNMLKMNDLTLHHIDKLENLRLAFGGPLRVNSGYRSPAHNKSVGGAERSMHLEFATDLRPLRLKNETSDLIDKLSILNTLAIELNFTGIGRYDQFIHLDCRDFIGRQSARWDHRSKEWRQ